MQPTLVETYSSIFANVVTGVTAILVGWVAVRGLITWRQQLIGQSKFESARKLLLLARRFRAEFGRARRPWTWSSEYEGRIRGEKESEAETQLYNEQYALLKRLEPSANILPELEQAVWILKT